MRDSILKGTGNSRFLKSGIPDGTTWAEALAMLRAGTFPMDLNGINSAGFQQVGTPLNKVNLLKDVNALTLGLTGDAVPNDMFNVLAHAGDLHVWKKTVGSTVTYPVSTNRNAYQEGSDAKPAGYTLGEVKTGKHILSYQHSDLNEIHWEYSSRITVSDDGTVSLVSPSSEDIDGGDYTSVAENLIGKFARPTEDHSGFKTNVIVFFPSDATVTRDTTTYGYNAMTISKYQPVTGYAAVPANTTIEYLGCLGEKARMQVVSYVGTGTYGADNPCSLTFDFPPKVVMFIDYVYTDGGSRGNHFVNNYSNIYYEMTRMSTEKLTGGYTQNNGFGGYSSQLYGKKTNGGKTITWYAQSGSNYQANTSNYVYYYLGIG